MIFFLGFSRLAKRVKLKQPLTVFQHPLLPHLVPPQGILPHVLRQLSSLSFPPRSTTPRQSSSLSSPLRSTTSRQSSSRSSPSRPCSFYSMYSYTSPKPSTSFSCSSPCSSPNRKRPRNKTTGPTMKSRSTPTEAFEVSVTQQYNVCLATEEKGQWVGCSHRGKKCDYWVHDFCTGFSFKKKKILKQVAFLCPKHNK